ncbi:MAG TPA: response regulator transcription factor [Thermoleophilaceae bacterium]|jgi:two-component system nitrate/nitrite response regulator NarL|nr:response regulator transcription factor [Thermoleophilaceae bacterium]
MSATAVRKQSLGTPTTMRPLSVLVAEDHPLYRRGVVKALAARPLDFDVVGEADDGLRALAMIEQLQPDVALLDLRMPGLDGLEICERLRDLDPPLPTKVLLLSAFDDPELVASAIAAGAAGYLDKHVSHQELCNAIVQVGAGGIAYTHRTAAGLARRFEELFR